MAVNLPEVLDGTTMKPVRILHPSEIAANLSILSVSSADIRVLISEGIALGDWVRVYFPNGKNAVFRVGNPAYDYDRDTMSATMAHGCVTLADSVVDTGYEEDKDGNYKDVYFEGTIKKVLTKLLGYQRTAHWKLGTVEPTDTVKIRVKYDDILTLINDAMEQVDDAYVDYDQSSYPWKIHVRKVPTEVASEGRLSRNVRSARVSYDDSELITKLYCNKLKEPLTSKNVSKYGLREGFYFVSSDDIDWVKKACNKYLKNREKPDVSISIGGADFSQITGVDIDRIVLADRYRLAIPKYNTVVEEQITELTYNDLIQRPNECSVTLGSHKSDLAAVLAKANSTASSANTTANYVAAQTQDHWERFIGDVEGLNTLISQTKEMIKMEANDVENRLHAELSITASQIQSKLTSGWTGYESRITQTADQIRMEVENKFFGLSSSILQTAENIRLQVQDVREQTQAQIDVNKRDISLKVSEKDLTASFVIGIINGTTTAQINASRINLKGYVTATQLSSGDINFYKLHSSKGGITCYTTSTTKLTVGGVDCSNIYKAFKAVEAMETNGNVTLTFTDFTTGNHNTKSVTFKKAARLKGSWSDGVYTASPDPTGIFTTVSTNISSTPYSVRYVESMLTMKNTYMVEIGYTDGGALKSTGRTITFVATEAYEAGMRAATPSAPSYSGVWSYGTLTVKANDVGVYSKTVNKVDQIEDEDVVWSPAYKNLLATLVIRDQQDEDIGYHPLIVMPAAKAYEAGWKANHDSNKYSIEMASDAEYKDVKRPGASSDAAAEMWFRLRMQAEWATNPGSDDITESNTVTWNTQRRLSGGSSWDNVLSVPSTITLSAASNGKTVYAKVGAKNVAKIGITHTPTVKDWSITGVSYASGGLSKKDASALRITAQVGVDGKDYSKLITTAKEFSLGKLINDDEYAALKYGSTAVAWLKMPERPAPTVKDWSITGVSYASGGLSKKAASALRITAQVGVDGTKYSKLITTAKEFSLGKLIGDDEYAALKYGSTAVAWLKMPERTIPEPTVSDIQLTGISPYGTIAAGKTAKASIGISFKVNDTTITQTLVTGNSFSLSEGMFGAYYILKYGSKVIAWLTPS